MSLDEIINSDILEMPGFIKTVYFSRNIFLSQLGNHFYNMTNNCKRCKVRFLMQQELEHIIPDFYSRPNLTFHCVHKIDLNFFALKIFIIFFKQ